MKAKATKDRKHRNAVVKKGTRVKTRHGLGTVIKICRKPSLTGNRNTFSGPYPHEVMGQCEVKLDKPARMRNPFGGGMISGLKTLFLNVAHPDGYFKHEFTVIQ